MARYDLESLVNDLKAICQANLNTKLAAIDVEKNDGLTSYQIPITAYLFQDLRQESVAPHKAIMFFGIDDPESNGIGPATLERVEIYFIVICQRYPDAVEFHTRLLRYMRALKEIFEENWHTLPNANRYTISSLSPTTLEGPGFQAGYKAVGVKVQAILS